MLAKSTPRRQVKRNRFEGLRSNWLKNFVTVQEALASEFEFVAIHDKTIQVYLITFDAREFHCLCKPRPPFLTISRFHLVDVQRQLSYRKSPALGRVDRVHRLSKRLAI